MSENTGTQGIEQAPETVVRDQAGKFTRLDQADASTYRRVRDGEPADEAKAEPVTGTESAADFKQKREDAIEKKSKGGGFQRRIDTLVRRIASAEESKAAMAEKLARYESAEAPAKADEQAGKVEAGDDKGAAKGEAAEPGWSKEEHEKRFVEVPNRLMQELAEEKDGDGKSVLEKVHIPHAFGEFFIRAVADLKNPATVLKQLAENPDIVEGFDWTSQRGVENILSDLSHLDRRKAREATTPKITSKAAAPIRPVGGGSARSTVPLDEMNMRDFKKAREAGRIR